MRIPRSNYIAVQTRLYDEVVSLFEVLLYPYKRIYIFSTETDISSERVHAMKEDVDVIALKIDH